jgi:hypothetical protein
MYWVLHNGSFIPERYSIRHGSFTSEWRKYYIEYEQKPSPVVTYLLQSFVDSFVFQDPTCRAGTLLP